MTGTAEARRRAYAAELADATGVRTPALLDALAVVPRERYLHAGPWLARAEGDSGRPRATPDADPVHLYCNASIAIDADRQLFNGAPGVVVPWLDALALRPGARVLHLGCGLGYYTALMAHVAGPDGRVHAVEVDAALAAEARRNLQDMEWVDVTHGDGTDAGRHVYDGILVSAGVTHPHRAWLDALAPGGRLLVPLTVTMAALGPLGKGRAFLFANDRGGRELSARPLTMVMIYSALGIRDETLNQALGSAFMRAPAADVSRLRRDSHPASDSCWLHTDEFCLAP